MHSLFCIGVRHPPIILMFLYYKTPINLKFDQISTEVVMCKCKLPKFIYIGLKLTFMNDYTKLNSKKNSV